MAYDDDDYDPDEVDEEQPPRRGGRGPRGRPRRGGPRRPRGGGGGAAAIFANPLARIVLALAGVALLVFVITMAVQSCQRNRLVDSYEKYIEGVRSVTADSSAQGGALLSRMENEVGDQPPAIQAGIRQLADDAQALVERGQDLNPPDRLDDAQTSLITALQYRVNGLRSLADNLIPITTNDNDFGGEAIARAMARFLTSDVIYTDSFLEPAKRALEADDINGIEVPEGNAALFLDRNVRYAAPGGARTLVPGLKRVGDGQGEGGANAVHGLALVRTDALPSGAQLQAGTLSSLQDSGDLRWRVTVENQGDFVESSVVVRATFSYPGDGGAGAPQEQTIASIEPGADKQQSVEIPAPSDRRFGERGSLLIEVVPLTTERFTDNNRAEYPVTIVP